MDTTPTSEPSQAGLSPSTKSHTLVLEAHLCNGKSLNKNINLSDVDIEKIWSDSLKRDWIEIDGFKVRKVADNAIRITYELGFDEPIRSIVSEPEISYQRRSLFGPETFTLHVLGLQDLREAKIGEIHSEIKASLFHNSRNVT